MRWPDPRRSVAAPTTPEPPRSRPSPKLFQTGQPPGHQPCAHGAPGPNGATKPAISGPANRLAGTADYGSSRLYRTVCKNYGVETYRYKGQRYTTLNIKSTKDVEDIIDQEFDDLFDQWRKLTDEILSELIERYEIGEAALLEKNAAKPTQVNSVQ